MEIGYQQELMNQFERYLLDEEKSYNTIQKYIRDVRKFLYYCADKEMNKKLVMSYKDELVTCYKSTSVNSILAAINHFLEWQGYSQFRVKSLKIQQNMFENPKIEMTQSEYRKLVACAEEKGDKRLSLLLQTICSTGIRVSELPYITVESLLLGRSEVNSKGKNRIIFLPRSLCQKLLRYCKEKEIISGSIFLTSTGNTMDRSNIWKMIKRLGEQANLLKSKVFPHNLRHLFAKTYYKLNHDITKLADLLGHSNIETTRIYIKESGNDHFKQLEKMELTFPELGTT